MLACRRAPSLPHAWWHRCCHLPHTRHGIVACHLPHAQCGFSVVVFLMPGVASSLLSSSRPSWHRRLSSSSCPGWHLYCRLPHVRHGISVDECQDPASTTPCSSTGYVDFVLRSGRSYSHFWCTHTPLVLTHLAGVRCPHGIRHAQRALCHVCTHMLYVVLLSSHTHRSVYGILRFCSLRLSV